ncbi:hypothetical protein CC86DRAFT_374782 [Ophiobolus disseminans]|uniref:DUF6594 domain-containing protein n=1 Tax=Ophiobolus disseminans TaxID=1469910 RepID=A0A6A6ZIF2_9PLEO|nr:hypothetical protein CC86DRAFT_374782 [Ophiobolus disseminans]
MATTGPALKEIKSHGYNRMARMMGKSDNLAIFRRFNDLNMLTLLDLQSEIQVLRDRLYLQCEKDFEDGEKFSTSMAKLRGSPSTGNSAQLTLLSSIRTKMNEYNVLLLQVSELSKLAKPHKSYLTRLRKWLGDRKGGMQDGVFEHLESWVWKEQDHRGEPTQHDFVTLAEPKVERDYFTRAVIYPLVTFYHVVWGRKHLNKQNAVDLESGVVEYDEEKLDRVGMVISTILASILPVIAVLGLFFVDDLLKRIYIMIGITGGFAGLLALLSNGKGKRIEIFAATATFAAVEVVFIGSTAFSGTS